ncbi:ribbon-helix-helix domain-containing protein [Leptodesmis sichuanensis]|uniref:ribbon-helix-helix domain-containing protein n=1 Tax=Leptodesmis sichuanensis TaxID=2906798 RepID=UPI001F1CB11B|nr:hypothetical protein [Leptodesmis sichuanensis]
MQCNCGIIPEQEDWANQQGRPVANLATFLVELGLRDAKEKGDYIPQKPTNQRS